MAKSRSQQAGDTLSWFFDFSAECFRFREPGKAYVADDVVRPPTATGYEYKCTTAGQTRGDWTRPQEPRWPTTSGATITDGSVVWTSQAISVDGLRRTVAGKAVTPETGLTAVSSSIVNASDRQGVTVALQADAAADALACAVRASFSDGEDRELVLTLEITE